MKEIALWVLLAIFLINGILMKENQSEATDDADSQIPIDNRTILIEEEKEQEEINVTTATDIKKEPLVNASKTQ